MKRRAALLISMALASRPFAARAQAAQKTIRVGWLSLGAPRERFGRFLTAMRAQGYEEGRNIAIDFRHAENIEERLAALAIDMAKTRPDLIIAGSNAEVLAAKRATSTIPIVVMQALEPVESGLVDSLARPGGNVTGTAIQGSEHGGKLLEVLRDAVPRVKRVALLVEPGNPGMAGYIREARRAADVLRVRLTLHPGSTLAEIETAFAAIARERPDALYVAATGTIFNHRDRVIEFAARHHLPAIYTNKVHVVAGGLLSYAPDYVALERRTIAIIDRVLKGARPADIPVEQPTVFELAVNLKTAKALGITLPPSIMVRATDVIE